MMPRKIISILTLLFLSFQSIGQTGWELLSPSPTTSDLQDVHAFDSLSFIVVGSNGAIHKTQDGGETWSMKSIGKNIKFYAMHFPTNSVGYIVGESGTVYKTNNAGDTWDQQNTPTSKTLLRVFFSSEDIGMAVGAEGTVLKTTNGGQSWINLASPSNVDFHSIFFWDANTGWIGGRSGIILKTTNGGLSWVSQFSNVVDIISDIYFKDQTSGWLFGPSGYFLKTTNGGNNWIRVDLGNGNRISRVKFDATGYGIGIGKQSVYDAVYDVSNFGDNWNRRTFIAGSNNTGRFHSAVCRFGGKHVWVTARSGRVLTSSNAGQTFRFVTRMLLTNNPDNPSGFTYVQFLDTLNGYLFKGFGLTKSSDGGKTWRQAGISPNLPNYPLTFPNSVYFKDTLLGVACQYFGPMFVTTNGGRDWSHRSFGVGVNSVTITNDYKIWACGRNGIIAHSADSGITWFSSGSLANADLTEIVFTDSFNGVCFGREVILKTSDGGQNWIAYRLQDLNLRNVCFTNNLKGFSYNTFNPGSGVYQTLDGGLTWNMMMIVPFWNYKIMKFASEMVGYVCDNNHIFKTTNGGTSWFDTGFYEVYGDYLSVLDENHVWVCGEIASLARTSTGGVVPLQVDFKIPPRELTAYPNPSNGLVFFGEKGDNITNLAIFDIKGKQVDAQYLNGYLDLSHLNPGLYFIRAFVNGKPGLTRVSKF